MIEPEPLQQIARTYVRFHGRKLSYFSGCDYYRLASHPEVLAALQIAVRRYGLNVAASRLTTGNHVLYAELEARLAGFFQAESALLISSGYMTNLAAAQALGGNFSHALIDEESHPSLRDAARFLDCPVLQFRHLDPTDLAASVRRCGPEARLILLTDGMFSHNGAAAPLAAYLEVLPPDAMMLVDDAHGAGVLGENGRGTLEYAKIGRDRIIQTITLSKAFGTFGGAVLCTRAFRERIISHSPMFVGSTPPPLPVVYAALRAVRILTSGKRLLWRLRENLAYVKGLLRKTDVTLPEAPSPIIAVVPDREAVSARMRTMLLDQGIYPPFIRYPGGPPNGYFRFVISSEHTRPQLDALSRVLTKVGGCSGRR
jgi:7-keto-8-aminopelargonate synthetase-like enzyme